MLTALILAGLTLALGACDRHTPGPIVGGPCSYETSIIEATVIEADEDGAVFMGPEGEFYVSDEYLRTVPDVGAILTLQRERITEGTCTPEIYTVLKRG